MPGTRRIYQLDTIDQSDINSTFNLPSEDSVGTDTVRITLGQLLQYLFNGAANDNYIFENFNSNISLGNVSTASGYASLAVGSGNTSSATYSTAAGYRNSSSAYGTSTFGSYNTANESQATALGFANTASGNSSSSIGCDNTSSGNYSSAFGCNNTVNGNNSTVIGGHCSNSGQYCTVIGNWSEYSGSASQCTIIGYNAYATGGETTTIGCQVNSNNAYHTIIVGHLSSTDSNYSTVVGVNSNASSGTYGTVIGYGNGIENSRANAIGYANLATGDSASAIGSNNAATGQTSSAFGAGNTASGSYSAAFGYSNQASNYATAFGYSNVASGNRSVAFGHENTSSGNYSVASGYQNTASAIYSVASGYSNTASNSYSVAVGTRNTSSGYYSHAFGIELTSSGRYSGAFGIRSSAGGNYSTAIGYGNTSGVINSHTLGGFNFVTSSGSYSSIAFGLLNNANLNGASFDFNTGVISNYWEVANDGNNRKSSTAVGIRNTVIGTYSNAFGSRNTASSGYGATAIGHGNTASAYVTTAIGYENSVTGIGATASGYQNTASNSYSSAFGAYNTASGWRGIALGFRNTASNNASIAVGYENTASGEYSTVVGNDNTTSGTYSNIFGYANHAIGTLSTIFGAYNNVYDQNSLAYGLGNIVYTENANAFGSNNAVNGINASAFGGFNYAIGNSAQAFGSLNTVGYIDWENSYDITDITISGSQTLITISDPDSFVYTEVYWYNWYNLGVAAWIQDNTSNLGIYQIGSATHDGDNTIIHINRILPAFTIRGTLTIGSQVVWGEGSPYAIVDVNTGDGGSFVVTGDATYWQEYLTAGQTVYVRSDGGTTQLYTVASIVSGGGNSVVTVNQYLNPGSTGNISFGHQILWNIYGDSPRTDNIIGVDLGSNTFAIGGDERWVYDTAGFIRVDGSSSNNGIYHIVSGHDGVTYGDGDTLIKVVETIPSDTGDGTLIGGQTVANKNLKSAAIGYNNIATGYDADAIGTLNTASGAYSTAIGNWNTASDYSAEAVGGYNTASGFYSTAFGVLNHATGHSSVAFGNNCQSTDFYTVAFGKDTNATAQDATALGVENTASGEYSTAVGHSNVASAIGSCAFGTNNSVNGPNSIAIGVGTSNSGYFCTVIGGESSYSGSSSQCVVIGWSAFATGGESTTIGCMVNSYGYNQTLVIGFGSSSSGNYSTVVGVNNYGSSGSYGTIVGYGNNVGNNNATAIGNRQSATGYGSVAAGYSNTASGLYASVFGAYNTASGGNSTALGFSNSATAPWGSSAVGHGNAASTNQASAFGHNNSASGHSSSAFGYNNNTSSTNSTAVGYENTISGTGTSNAIGANNSISGFETQNASAIGVNNTVSSYSSNGNAFGSYNTVSNYYASAFGYSNNASGIASTAIGWENNATGEGATASGYNNTASSYQSTASGAYNIASGEQQNSAFGWSNTAAARNTSAFGWNNTAEGDESSAFGYVNHTYNYQSNAFGYSNTAAGNYTNSFGSNNTVNKLNAQAFGAWNFTSSSGSYGAVMFGLMNNTSGAWLDSSTGAITGGTPGAADVVGNLSTSVGVLNFASGENAVAVGYYNTASGYNSVSLGYYQTASGDYASALGVYNSASGDYSTASGYDNTASGRNSSAFGCDNTVSGQQSIVVGHGSYNSGDYCTVVGCNAEYSGSSTGCVVIGYNAYSYGNTSVTIGSSVNSYNANQSVVVGYNSNSAGDYSTVIGVSNTGSSGSYGTIVGYNNSIGDNRASAFGNGLVANGYGSTACGYSSTASGLYASVFGAYNSASAGHSTACGYNNTASGSWGTSAVGHENTASENQASAFGHSNTASGHSSTAFGFNNVADGNYSTACGYSNIASAGYSAAIGANAIARIDRTTNIGGAIIIRKDNDEGSINEVLSLSGAETIIMSMVYDLGTTPNLEIDLPSGCSFFPDECGLIITKGVGVTGQPTISMGDEGGYDTLVSAVETTGLTSFNNRQRFTSLTDSNGHTQLRASVNSAATATNLTGRFYWKGLLVEDTVEGDPYFDSGSGSYTSPLYEHFYISYLPDSTIYYTTDGSDPNTGSSVYDGSLEIDISQTVKILAVSSRGQWSNIESATYNMTVATPTFSPDGGDYDNAQSVTINCTTPGVTIYYTTDGSDPTTGSTLYTGPVDVSVTETLKAFAILSGANDSGIGSATYVLYCADPVFSLDTGSYDNVQSTTITTATSGAAIYYTTDGSDPDSGSTLYTGSISINETETIKAIAILAWFSNSNIIEKDYTLFCMPPEFSPGGGSSFDNNQSLELFTPTSGATIYYTTDGSTPTDLSSVYSTAISINTSEAVKAIAILSGFSNSGVVTATYTLFCDTPTFSPDAGSYDVAQSVTINCGTSGVTMYYTTDDSDPTTGSTLYTGPVDVGVSETLKALAVKTGYTDSSIGSANYGIGTPFITTDSFTNHFNFSVTVYGTVDGDSGMTDYGFVWNTSGSFPTLSDNVVSVGSGPFSGSFNDDIGSLPGTTVYFAAYAVNGSGTAYGSIVNCYPGPCFITGTKIALSDRTEKNIEDVTYDDELLVWNFDEGKFDCARPVWISTPWQAKEYALVKFSDGTELGTPDDGHGHRIFNTKKGMFTHLMNEDTPVGTKTFNKNREAVSVVDKGTVNKNTTFYNIITHTHINVFANGILTSTGLNNIYPIKDMIFIKNDVVDNSIVFANVSHEMSIGLRLSEQPACYPDLKAKISRIMEQQKI